jgi:hypothetical protein
MGEAKRRLIAAQRSPCICGSSRPAGDCCHTGVFWQKPAARLALDQPETGDRREFPACDGILSGEHMISESVMRLLANEGEFTIGGTPWLAKGEFKPVGFQALKTKCLCQRHNSALHHLDDAALSFFTALRTAFESEGGAPAAIVSGHDLERWLLKTLKAMAVSRNLGRDQDRLSGAFTDGIDVPRLLQDIGAWPEGAGLYCVMAPGDRTHNLSACPDDDRGRHTLRSVGQYPWGELRADAGTARFGAQPAGCARRAPPWRNHSRVPASEKRHPYQLGGWQAASQCAAAQASRLCRSAKVDVSLVTPLGRGAKWRSLDRFGRCSNICAWVSPDSRRRQA